MLEERLIQLAEAQGTDIKLLTQRINAIGDTANSAYVYTQSIAASIWVINHNLDVTVAHVSVRSAAGALLEGYEVDYTSRFQVRLTFSPPAAGTARIS